MPIAVLTSDIHFNINTLPVASKALQLAVDKAGELGVNLIVAGDLHDTKANIRAECITAIRTIFKSTHIQIFVMRGNHDSWNEKADKSVFDFLEDIENVSVVDFPHIIIRSPNPNLRLIPYQHNPANFLLQLSKDAINIVHQGISGSHSGEYIQDKSAVDKYDVSDYRIISGHYHRRQDIKTGRPQKGAIGLWSYIGNPYTLTFGEAEDPEKGFQILYDDGLLEFVPTGLRKHVKIEMTSELEITSRTTTVLFPEDIVRVKVTGTRERLATLKREAIAKKLGIENFQLETSVLNKVATAPKNLPQHELLDSLIDNISNTSDEQKNTLKSLWKELSK